MAKVGAAPPTPAQHLGAPPHRLVAMAKEDVRPAAGSPKSLSGLLPFIRPYRLQVALAGLLLVLAALSTLAFPVALKLLIDQGLVAADPGERVMACAGTSWRCLAWPRRWALFGRALLRRELAGRTHHRRLAQRGLRPRAAPEPRVL
jgi:hypothetical protein